MEPGITIVMPALNEENNIRPSILLVQKIFKDLKPFYFLVEVRVLMILKIILQEENFLNQ